MEILGAIRLYWSKQTGQLFPKIFGNLTISILGSPKLGTRSFYG
jgi:hypothetical protein